jgi:chromosome segregation ATPase
MSLDYLALVQDCIPRRDAEATRAELAGRARELEVQVTALMERNAGLESATAAWGVRKADQERELAALAARNIELEQQSDALQAGLSEQAAELARLRAILQRSWRERLWARLQRWRSQM